MNNIRIGGFSLLPPIVKNILIINLLCFFAKVVAIRFGIDLNSWLGLHFIGSSLFYPWQILTYMFMHGDFSHLFFNMFALWMFGSTIENYWGSKRFLIYYILTGVGAGLTHYAVLAYQMLPDLALIDHFLDNPTRENLLAVAQGHVFHVSPHAGEIYEKFLALQQLPIMNATTTELNQVSAFLAEYRDYYLCQPNVIGASGSIFGLLLAFGMLFPNAQIYLYFLLPIKAKWFVVLYGALELFYGISGTQDGVAHFAHLGGMLFGILLILYWRRNSKNTHEYEY